MPRYNDYFVLFEMEVGFEPTMRWQQTVLQTVAFDHSATPSKYQYVKEQKTRLSFGNRVQFVCLRLSYQSMISFPPEPGSAIFLPVKTEQNIPFPLRLPVVDGDDTSVLELIAVMCSI